MILVAIGSNLPGPGGETPRQTCIAAAAAVRGIPGISFAALSRWYRTAPVPASDQPDYCNGVMRLEGDPAPAALLAALHRIEDAFGRRRSVLNAARCIDLDLIDLNGLVRGDQAPVLPHPRAHLRRFVLQPLMDVAPDWRHPLLDLPVATLLEGADGPPIGLWDEP